MAFRRQPSLALSWVSGGGRHGFGTRRGHALEIRSSESAGIDVGGPSSSQASTSTIRSRVRPSSSSRSAEGGAASSRRASSRSRITCSSCGSASCPKLVVPSGRPAPVQAEARAAGGSARVPGNNSLNTTLGRGSRRAGSAGPARDRVDLTDRSGPCVGNARRRGACVRRPPATSPALLGTQLVARHSARQIPQP
jgi:hypothetical protein